MTQGKAAASQQASSPARSPPLAVGTAFLALVVLFAWNMPAADLTASYVAGKLVAEGQTGQIYHLTTDEKVPQRDLAWLAVATRAGIAGDRLTASVQTPLWAWLMAPIASVLPFAAFKRLFAGLTAVSALVIVDRAAGLWAPGLRGNLAQAALLAVLCATVPFEQGIILGQTHLLFLCLSVLSVWACRSGRPVLAGALLAVAACVKITPGWLALTWLVSGQQRAAASFAAWLAALTLLAIQTEGWAVFRSYLSQLRRYGHELLLSFNNDSLAAVLMGGHLTAGTAFRFETIALPGWVSLLSGAAAAAAALCAGLLDRRLARLGRAQTGAVLTLVAATAAAPLAWNHYFVVLLLPAMLFVEEARGRRRWAWAALAVIVVLLNMWPLAYTVGAPMRAVARRSEFWAACLCVLGVTVLGLTAKAATGRLPPASPG